MAELLEKDLILAIAFSTSVCATLIGHVLSNQKLRQTEYITFLLLPFFLFICSLELVILGDGVKPWYIYAIIGIFFILGFLAFLNYLYDKHFFREHLFWHFLICSMIYLSIIVIIVYIIKDNLSEFINAKALFGLGWFFITLFLVLYFTQTYYYYLRTIFNAPFISTNIKIPYISKSSESISHLNLNNDEVQDKNQKVYSGIYFMDTLLGGGLDVGDVVMLEGEIGTSLEDVMTHLLYAGLRQGYNSIYVPLSRTPESIFSKYDHNIKSFNNKLKSFINALITLQEKPESLFFERFDWNEVTENDYKRLIESLKLNFRIGWVSRAEFEKLDENTIRVSSVGNYIIIKYDSEKSKVSLEFSDGRFVELDAKKENDGKLYIYFIDNREFWKVIINNLIYELEKFAYNHEELTKYRKKLQNKIKMNEKLAENDIIDGIRDIIIDSKIKGLLKIFSWDEIPGKDNNRLIEYLKQNFGINWVNTAKIQKTDENTIRLSSGDKFVSFKLDSKRTKAILEFWNGKTDEFIVKTVKNDKLIIYDIYDKNVLPTFEDFLKLNRLYIIDYNTSLIKRDRPEKLLKENELKYRKLLKGDRYLKIDKAVDIGNLHNCIKVLRKIIRDKKQESGPVWMVWDSSSTIFHLTVRDSDSLHKTMDYFFHQACSTKENNFIVFHSYKKGMHDERSVKHLEHVADSVVNLYVNDKLSTIPFKFLRVIKKKNANILSIEIPYHINEGFVDKMWW